MRLQIYIHISTRQFLPCNFHKSYPAFVCATVCHLSLKSVSLLTRKGPNAQHHDNDNDDNSAPTCFKQANISKLDVCGRMLPQPFPSATCRRINSYINSVHVIPSSTVSTCILHVFYMYTLYLPHGRGDLPSMCQAARARGHRLYHTPDTVTEHDQTTYKQLLGSTISTCCGQSCP